eukprot:887732-Amorphochlora_amoeboformis.AAC.1
MPTDVRNQVQEIIRAMGNLTEKEAKTFMFRSREGEGGRERERREFGMKEIACWAGVLIRCLSYQA